MGVFSSEHADHFHYDQRNRPTRAGRSIEIVQYIYISVNNRAGTNTVYINI